MAKYEFDGNKYLKASKHQKEWGRKLIEELNIQKNDCILDLGCGDGLLTKMMAEIATDGFILGIDASEGMISRANKYKMPNLEFDQIDINDITFENMFSIIISNATLHWIKNHNKLLTNCYNALKKEGILRFNFAGDGNCSNFIKVVKTKMRSNKFRSYFNDFVWPWFMPCKEEYEKLVDNHFSEFEIWEENADRYFGNEEEMIRWIDQPSIVPFLGCLNDEKVKTEFRDEVVSDMIEITKEKDGRCFETFRRINIYAKK